MEFFTGELASGSSNTGFKITIGKSEIISKDSNDVGFFIEQALEQIFIRAGLKGPVVFILEDKSKYYLVHFDETGSVFEDTYQYDKSDFPNKEDLDIVLDGYDKETDFVDARILNNEQIEVTTSEGSALYNIKEFPLRMHLSKVKQAVAIGKSYAVAALFVLITVLFETLFFPGFKERKMTEAMHKKGSLTVDGRKLREKMKSAERLLASSRNQNDFLKKDDLMKKQGEIIKIVNRFH